MKRQLSVWLIGTKLHFLIIPSRGNGGRLARRDVFSLNREKAGCYHNHDSNLQTYAKKANNLLHGQKPPALFQRQVRKFPPLPFHIIHLYCQTLLVLRKLGDRIALSYVCGDKLTAWQTKTIIGKPCPKKENAICELTLLIWN